MEEIGKRVFLKRAAALTAVISIAVTGTASASGIPEDGWYREKYHSDADYSEMKYEGFDRTEVDGLLDELEKICSSGERGREETVLNLYNGIISQTDVLDTQGTLNSLIYYKDATNKEAQEREQELSKISNEVYDRCFIVLKKALDSSYGPLLREKIGISGVEQLEDYKPMTDKEFALKEKELSLTQEYNEAVLDSYTTVVDGEEWTTERYNEEPPEDEEKNFDIYTALIEEENSVAAEIYRELVQVRNDIARENGYENYADYAYEQIYRRDFSTDDIKSVYQAVKDNVVPLLEDLQKAEWMTDIEALESETEGKTGEEILDTIEPYIGEVNPALTEAYSYMRNHHLYDIEADNQKLEVAFTTDIPSYGVPFIFNKPYGNYNDYRTMIHEFGHYNQMFHDMEPALWQTSRMDVYEIHSQGLEVLFYPYADDLFGDGGEAFQYETIGQMLYATREGCLYDEFQNEVYRNPDMSIEEINKTFLKIAKEYGYQYAEGADQAYGWISVPHTFESPMYYISYATSALASLDIWMESLENREGAIDKYMHLTALGGSEPFCKVIRDSGFNDIFQEDVIGETAASIRNIMKIDEKTDEYDKILNKKNSSAPKVLDIMIFAHSAALLFIIFYGKQKKEKDRG